MINMRLGDGTPKTVTLQTQAEVADPFRLQDLCDGLSREQWRIRQQTRDQTILNARDRVLSARSRTDTRSLRTHSRASSSRMRDVRERTQTYDAHSNVGDDTHAVDESEPGDANKQLVPIDLPGSESPEQSEYAESTYRSGADETVRVPEEQLHKLEYLSEPLMRSYTSLSGIPVVPAKSMCIRSKSAVNREVESMVRSLSRQCCDVLGPKVCHQCALLKRRVHSAHRHEIQLSRLQVSERNFADSIVLQKLLPHLSQEEIEDRVACGEISRLPLRERIYEHKQRLASENRRRSIMSVMSTRSSEQDNTPRSTENRLANASTSSSTFFVNIQDLNSKLLTRKLTSNWARIKSEAQRMSTRSRSTTSHSESFSAKYKQFYEPPLLPKACQNPEPSFFAGRSGAYKLPDRLPDTVVDGQISDMSSFNAAWTGSQPQSEDDMAR